MTAKALGFKKGDFVTTGYFPAIVAGHVNTSTPLCEVWGVEHECGSAYANELRRISFVEFCELAGRYGHLPNANDAILPAARESLAQARR